MGQSQQSLDLDYKILLLRIFRDPDGDAISCCRGDRGLRVQSTCFRIASAAIIQTIPIMPQFRPR